MPPSLPQSLDFSGKGPMKRRCFLNTAAAVRTYAYYILLRRMQAAATLNILARTVLVQSELRWK